MNLFSKILEKYLKIKPNIFLYLILFIELLIIFSSFTWSSYKSYFWPDHSYVEYVHNLSLEKSILEVLSVSNNFNGITLTILNPYLNPLSFLNYNLSSIFDYKLYLFFFTLIEISIIVVHVSYFAKKISIKKIILIIFIYIIYLSNFSGFDHQSYINFPIIVFCFFHGLSLYFQKNNILFFLILLVGNIWSYLINPVYFFVTCFSPLLFYYAYFFFIKSYKKIILIFLANLFVAIPYILIAIGTSRIALSDFYTASANRYNFNIFESKGVLILSIVTLIFAIRLLYERREYFFSTLFVIINFLTIGFGALYEYKYDFWKLPQPEYLDYAFQYIYILIIFIIIHAQKRDKFTYLLSTIFLLVFFYKSYSFVNQYIYMKNTSEVLFYDEKKIYLKKFFWDKGSGKYLFKKELHYKNTLINLPNIGSELYIYSHNYKTGNAIDHYELTKYLYNSDFDGSLSFVSFWRNNINTHGGHSQYLNISSTLANLENFNIQLGNRLNTSYTKDKIHLSGNQIIERQSIPPISPGNALLDFYHVEYILSDMPLSYQLYKKYELDKYNIYLYKISQKKNNKIINKINYFSDFNTYYKNIKKFSHELFLFNTSKNNIINTNKFCEVKKNNNTINKSIFDVVTDNEKCVAIFPISFSHNNNFYIVNENSKIIEKCLTFRAQYFFHGCIITKNSKVELIKNNIIYYPLGSLKDFFDLKKLKIL
jgi:hypothetical protein